MICGRCGHKIEDSSAVCMRCRLAFPENISSVRKVKLPPRRSRIVKRVIIGGAAFGIGLTAVGLFVLKTDLISTLIMSVSGSASGAALAFLPKWTLGAYYRMRLNQAQRAFDHRLESVTRRYEKRLEENEIDRKAMHELGIACLSSHDFQKAINLFQRAAELEEDPGRLYNHLGIAFFAQRKFDQAMEAWNKSLDYCPDYAPTHFNCATASIQLGKYEQALAEFDRAILGDEAGTRERMPMQMGALRFGQGEIGGAVQEFTRAVEREPDSGDLRNNLGISYYKYGENSRGISELYAAQRVEPGHARSYANLGLIELIEGQPAEAVVTLLHAKNLESSSSAIRAYYGLALYRGWRDRSRHPSVGNCSKDGRRRFRCSIQSWPHLHHGRRGGTWGRSTATGALDRAI